MQVAQEVVVEAPLVPVVGHVVAVAQPFEEVLVDDVGPGAVDGVDHVVADQVDEHLLQAGRDQRAGEAEDHAALAVGEHPVVDFGGPGQVAGRKRHPAHLPDQRSDVFSLDVDMLDPTGQQLCLGRTIGTTHDGKPSRKRGDRTQNTSDHESRNECELFDPNRSKHRRKFVNASPSVFVSLYPPIVKGGAAAAEKDAERQRDRETEGRRDGGTEGRRDGGDTWRV